MIYASGLTEPVSAFGHLWPCGCPMIHRNPHARVAFYPHDCSLATPQRAMASTHGQACTQAIPDDSFTLIHHTRSTP